MCLCTILWKTQCPGQLYFNQLAIEHHICNHANNCSSFKVRNINGHLWYPRCRVFLFTFAQIFGKVSEGEISELKQWINSFMELNS